ncbi:MAG: transposase [Acidimicrobiia bacterium]|nr:transposase [Acidimicrobiia bacterium]
MRVAGSNPVVRSIRGLATVLERQFPKAAAILAAAEADVTAYATFPRAHWMKIASTNPLERVHKEIERRSTSSGSSPTTPRCRASSVPS